MSPNTETRFVTLLLFSLNHAGEQWDFPNGWAPLQHLVVDALEMTGNPEAKALAFEIAEKWISSNYKAFQQSKKMFEKVFRGTLMSVGLLTELPVLNILV